MLKNDEGLVPCPLCKSNEVYVNSGVQFAVKCESCFHVKIQCFDTPGQAKRAWNKLFEKSNNDKDK